MREHQDHGWFGAGTSGNTPGPATREATAADLGRLVAQVTARSLPRNGRREFQDFTGRDSGKSLPEAMHVWAEASHLAPLG